MSMHLIFISLVKSLLNLVMSFVTYVLLTGIHMGLEKKNKKFSPDVLGMTATSAIFVLIVEVLLLKFGSSLISGTGASFMDLIAYCGYKFVAYF
jgi:hypothetical protein